MTNINFIHLSYHINNNNHIRYSKLIDIYGTGTISNIFQKPLNLHFSIINGLYIKKNIE